jgi:hypothetical protein
MENENTETYLSVLINSLIKKNEILSGLLELTRQQESIINEQEIDDDKFYSIIEEKGKLIQKVREIDDGFEHIFLRVKEGLTNDQNKYAGKIEAMQELIREVMDKVVKLQVLEKQNKMKLEIFLNNKRSEIKSFKVNNRIVSNYYKNMSKQYEQESYFFDTKK